MTDERPMVNVYEEVDGVETLVYRPMNDDEWEQRQLDVAEAEAAANAAPAPTLEDRVADAAAAAVAAVLPVVAPGATKAQRDQAQALARAAALDAATQG